jgi:biopolymer transport protein ExbB
MKRLMVFGVVAALFVTGTAGAQDVREAFRKAQADRQAALERAEAAEEAILNDREALVAKAEELEAQERELDAELSGLEQNVAALETRHERLTERWEREQLQYKEISGNIRLAARDLKALLEQSPLTALRPDRIDVAERVLGQGYFPDINDVKGMAYALFTEIEMTGQVGMREGMFVGRDGEEQTGDIMTIGPFTALYRTSEGGEVGFLTHTPAEQRLFALSALPPNRMAGLIRGYMNGESATVPVDISGGAALRQITQQVGFWEHLAQGGPIIFPIIAIGLVAVALIIYKFQFLQKVHGNTDRVMGEVTGLAARGDWEGAEAVVRRYEHRKMPVVEVIADGLSARDEDRETLESVMQEAILREMPRVERGLSVLAVFGAVAPLLGLLGTVTGMIETFRVITLYGTGDPRLMSAGISEALVTTELGLAVAIPIMLFHTFLSRRANAIIGEMEEKAVHLSNVILKQRMRRGEVSPDGSIDRESLMDQLVAKVVGRLQERTAN